MLQNYSNLPSFQKLHHAVMLQSSGFCSNLKNYLIWRCKLQSHLTLTPYKALLLNNRNPSKSNNCLCCVGELGLRHLDWHILRFVSEIYFNKYPFSCRLFMTLFRYFVFLQYDSVEINSNFCVCFYVMRTSA